MCEENENKDSEYIETTPVENGYNSERFKHLWFLCENCETLIYKKSLLEQKGVCAECGATLQMTSSERIELLIDNGTWRSINTKLSSIDVLEKKHTTFDIKMVRKVSILLYKVISGKYFYKEFFKNKYYNKALRILVAYNNTLVNILKVALGSKFIKYLNLDSKETIKILQDIIDTGLKTAQFALFEIRKKIKNEFYRFALLNKAFENKQISSLLAQNLEDRRDDESEIISIEFDRMAFRVQTFLILESLLKLNTQLADVKEQLLSQDKFLKAVATSLVKKELYFPEDKRKTRKIKKIFPFYPGTDPETDYFLWLRTHMAISLMERYLVLKEFKYWFRNRYCGLLEEEFPRFGSDILIEYVKKQDRYESYNMIDHIMQDDLHTSTNSVELFQQINLLFHHKNNEKDCDNNFLSYTENIKGIYFCLLEIMKQFSTLTLDSKDKFPKKKGRDTKDTEDIEDIDEEDIEEEYPLTYDSLTKEEKEYVDANIELIKSTFNLGKEEFIETEEQSYQDYNTSYQKETGLPDAIQTGVGEINGISVALGVMDFQFMGGSMGSVVGEKITRLIQFATENFLPLILVCASGGARMQEGSFSLMQMNKIAAMLHTYQKEKNLLYISVLTSPTTGGVTASFGMLANVTIVEPNAYIAFAGKRVIEQTLNQIVDDEDQISDSLFDFGMFDSMVPRALLKNVLSETIEIYMYGD
uniref:Acetyl-coenzyme A carboxylase carboxyl transferase subunit beta, chloroplastic n=1 Tax=Cryptomeria japonica var. sinensis TaxID=99810 RepID=A0A8K1VWV0_CRYJA|nr:acetyl-CoA carboxylase carboxyltransferase beta subunit [Cryptomeria japonica var. sinensis]